MGKTWMSMLIAVLGTGCPGPQFPEKVDTGTPCEPVPWYRDADSDSYGDLDVTVEACTAPEGYVATSGDCNDANPSIRPGATETCNDVDDDCNGLIDDNPAGAPTWYQDSDSDGYGDPTRTRQACEQPVGYSHQAGDCDDDDPTIHPDAPEVCDDTDNDCDDDIDEGLKEQVWFGDGDGDGYGDPKAMVTDCEQPTGSVVNGDDCNDGDATVHPSAEDPCGDGIDQDCSGTDASCFRALLSEWETDNLYLWDPVTGALDLFHVALSNDADCNEAEGSTQGWLAEHFNDQLLSFAPGTGSGTTLLTGTSYSYPKHLAMWAGQLIVMSRNDSILYRYDPISGEEVGSTNVEGISGQGVATDGAHLFVSVWDGTTTTILTLDSSFEEVARHGPPTGMFHNNLVDFAYAGDGLWYGMDVSGEGGTPTRTQTLIAFEMGGAVLDTVLLPIEIDGIGTFNCPM